MAVTDHTTTDFQALIAVLKGNIGPGCLALPWAFSILGLPIGCLTTLVLTFIVSWNAWTLVALKRQYWDTVQRGVTYSDVGEKVFGERFRIVVDISVITLQLAVCTVFISNISEDVSSVIQHILSGDNPTDSIDGKHEFVDFVSNRRFIMIMLIPPILILSFLPTLRRLAPSIALATIFLVLSFILMGIIIIFNWNTGVEEYRSNHLFWSDFIKEINWKEAPIATCAIMYSLEGQCSIFLCFQITFKN